MHFSSLALFSGLAAASALHHHGAQHFHPRRQFNASSIAAGSLTTLTIFATETKTITSCAASITDCPARPAEATSEQVVTEVLAIKTTVCPAAEASSASSVAIASFSATSTNDGVATSIPTFPLGTGFFATYDALPPPTSADVLTPAVSASTNSPVSDTVLTYVLGTGKSTTVVTTTIRHTQTSTIYATIPNAGPGAAETPAGGVPGDGISPPVKVVSTADGVVVPEPTTTIRQTSTSTKYVTVFPAPSSVEAGVPGAGNCAPVTVTVTEAASTVTVTEIAKATELPIGVPTYPSSAEVPSTSDSANSGSTIPVVGKVVSPPNDDAAPSSEAVIIETATLIPVPASTYAPIAPPSPTVSRGPYALNNGTVTSTRCSKDLPSGFVTSAKVTETSKAAAPVVDGGYPTYLDG